MGENAKYMMYLKSERLRSESSSVTYETRKVNWYQKVSSSTTLKNLGVDFSYTLLIYKKLPEVSRAQQFLNNLPNPVLEVSYKFPNFHLHQTYSPYLIGYKRQYHFTRIVYPCLLI